MAFRAVGTQHGRFLEMHTQQSKRPPSPLSLFKSLAVLTAPACYIRNLIAKPGFMLRMDGSQLPAGSEAGKPAVCIAQPPADPIQMNSWYFVALSDGDCWTRSERRKTVASAEAMNL